MLECLGREVGHASFLMASSLIVFGIVATSASSIDPDFKNKNLVANQLLRPRGLRPDEWRASQIFSQLRNPWSSIDSSDGICCTAMVASFELWPGKTSVKALLIVARRMMTISRASMAIGVINKAADEGRLT